MPTFLQKQKTSNSAFSGVADEFGPTSSFNAERFESFNSKVRMFNIFSNRQASSRDIASRLQSLMHISQSNSVDGNKRCHTSRIAPQQMYLPARISTKGFQVPNSYQCTLALDIQLAHPLIS
eukprot:Em0518g3a